MIDKLKSTIKNYIITISSLLIPVFQYIPCASIWFGIMSIPLITYLGYFLGNPEIAMQDFDFFLSYGFPWSVMALFGASFFIYSIIYQLIHRKELIRKGPYKYVRHPQYLGIIIMTLGLTMISLNTSPIFPFDNEFSYGNSLLVFIWFMEVIAYIILAKIEDFSLRRKYGKSFIEYENSVGFIIPILTIKQFKISESN
ncbi:MAG: methyltransferase family protein [Candidatus Hodarchaeota archaeon]